MSRVYILYLITMMASFHASMCLEHLLKSYRVRQAAQRDLPCYSVLGDVLIRQIIENKPKTGEDLCRIKGMSPQRCEWYGEDILRMVRQAPLLAVRMKDEPTPVPRREGSVVLRHGGGGGQRLTKPKPYQRTGEPGKMAKRVLSATSRPEAAGDDVYILELAQGRVYVGKSCNVTRRVGQVILCDTRSLWYQAEVFIGST